MIAFITDTHFGSRSFNKSLFEMQMQFFEKQLFPFLLKNGVKDVVHTGDCFHNRNIVDWYIFNGVKKRFFKWFEDNDIRLHLLVGNHCSYYKSTIETNSLTETTKEFSRVKVYDTPETTKIGPYTFHFMPWIVDESKVTFPDADVLCGHFDVSGLQLMRGIYSTDGYAIDTFKKYKIVASGHYHITSKRSNFYMVGTQYQTGWGDYCIDKGFYTLDDSFGMKYHQNTVSPRFVKIFYTEAGDEVKIKVVGERGEKPRDASKDDLLSVVRKNYCKLVVEKVLDQAAFESFFTSLQLKSRDGFKIEIVDANEVIESFDFEELEEKIRDESDTLEVMHSFVAGMTLDETISKDIVTNLLSQLYREAEELHTAADSGR